MAIQAFRGTALSGLENAPFDSLAIIGTNIFDFDQAYYNYFASKGFNLIRLPFAWERIQPTLSGDLDATYLGILDNEIAKAKSAGLKVLLDCHNYGRREVYLDGGFTENFQGNGDPNVNGYTPSLLYPYADFANNGFIVLKDYGESFFGTKNNPITPATGYVVSLTFSANSIEDTTLVGGEGFYVRLMKGDTSSSNYYEFGADFNANIWVLNLVKNGTKTVLATGAKEWGIGNIYNLSIDVNQGTNGKINVSLNSTPLFTLNTVNTDVTINKGYGSLFVLGHMHVQVSNLVLNVNSDTTSGGSKTYTVGTTQVTVAHLADMWTKLATHYKDETTVLGYDVMNEANNMPVPTTPSNYNSSATVTLMHQAVINAVRAVDTTHYISCGLDVWEGAQNFVNTYGANPTPWLTDPTGLLVYSFHYYFDDDHSGTYGGNNDGIPPTPFKTSNNDAIANDVTPVMQWANTNKLFLLAGEYGVPNTTDWQVCLTTFLNLCDNYNVWACQWAAGEGVHYNSATRFTPYGTTPNFTDVLQMAIVSQHLGQGFTTPPGNIPPPPTGGPMFSNDVPFPNLVNKTLVTTTGGSTYTLPNIIIESNTNSLPFTPRYDPVQAVDFQVMTKGTGDWTILVHDQQNRLIAQQLILNADIPPAGSVVKFVFNPVWRVSPNRLYHVHLISSNNTGIISVSTANDFSTAKANFYYATLVNDNQFHPIIDFFQYILIGNEHYVAQWDGAFYNPNRLTLPIGWKVRCFALWREFIAIGLWRGNNITDYPYGKIAFWDGQQDAVNFYVDIPEGPINAMFGVDTDLFLIAGYRGYLLDYQGTFMMDTGNGRGIKLKRVPKIQPQDIIEVYPSAMTMWRSLLHIGFGANMKSASIEQGVYSHGTLNQFYPDTMSYDYLISTGNSGNSVKIGLVYPVGENLIIGWQDGTDFAADNVNFSNPPAESGSVDTVVVDDNSIWKDKLNLNLRADILPLRDGEGVSLHYAIDRGSLVSPVKDQNINDTFVKSTITGGRGREYQIGVELTADNATSPTLLGLSILRDTLDSEQQF